MLPWSPPSHSVGNAFGIVVFWTVFWDSRFCLQYRPTMVRRTFCHIFRRVSKKQYFWTPNLNISDRPLMRKNSSKTPLPRKACPFDDSMAAITFLTVISVVERDLAHDPGAHGRLLAENHLCHSARPRCSERIEGRQGIRKRSIASVMPSRKVANEDL